MMPIVSLTADLLADKFFEPIMRADSVLGRSFIGQLLGTGSRWGIRLMFIISGLAALLVSRLVYADKHIRNIEDELPDAIRVE